MDLEALAERLFSGVMAPLVLGGPITPRHAIGARAAAALAGLAPNDRDLASRVAIGRVRRARRLVPVDAVPAPTGADWALAAALHDLFHAANPSFCTALRRGLAARILDVATMTLERVAPPATVSDALARHTWFARVEDVRRTDTTVSWWLGSRRFLGQSPPARLTAWPDLRRVVVARARHGLLELSPLAVDRSRLALAVSIFLARTPLTDIATCTRETPVFRWTPAVAGLLSTPAGRCLATRVLDRLPQPEVDAALGRATLALEGRVSICPPPILTLLADRALALASQQSDAPIERSGSPEGAFARALGAREAWRRVAAGGLSWSTDQGAGLLAALSRVAPGSAGSTVG